MAPIDWDRIAKFSKDLENTSADDVEIMYETMSSVQDFDDVSDLERLHLAIRVIQYIMINKAEESKTYVDELDDAQQEIKKLKDIKTELEAENAELQRGESSDINIVREKRNWEMEKEQMIEEIRRLKVDNNTLRSDKDSKDAKIHDFEQEVDRLRDENKKLSDNVTFLRDRTNLLKSQKDQTQDSNKSELAYVRSELRQKKIDLDNAQEKILELHQEIDRLKEAVNQSTETIEQMTAEYKNMKNNFGASDVDLQNKESEIRMLRTQVEHLQEQLTDKNESDDVIMNHVNQQVEKWKQIMAERDSEILRLYQENKKLRQDVHASGVNAEKANVQALIKLVKEREEQIKELTTKLADATRLIEDNGELISTLKNDLDQTGGGTTGHQMRRIKELRQIADEREQRLKELQQRLDAVEVQVSDREQELNDALEKNQMYEKGEYGLAEAVAEIKAVKAQLQVKDRQVEQLCQEVNKINFSVEELRFENGHLRNKLGIPIDEQLDIDGYKRQKAAQDEEERAMNIVLQKEIEKLEDERLMLKKKVRALARQAGLRAGSAGIAAGDIMDDFLALDLEQAMGMNSDEVVPVKRTRTLEAAPGATDITFRVREKEFGKELDRMVKDLEKRDTENAELVARNEQLRMEHEAMVEAHKTIKEELLSRRESKNTQDGIIECPSLDKLLTAMETKKLIGDYDTGLYMKTRIDHLEGRNEELRNELRQSRMELGNLRLQYDKVMEKARRMEEEYRILSGLDGDGVDIDKEFNLQGLPSNMTSSTSQTLAALNQHLIIILQEKTLKEQALEKADNALDSYRRKFALIRHQQGLLYRQYADEKAKYEAEIEACKTKIKDLEGLRSEDSVRINEFDRLTDVLSRDESQTKQKLADITREITLLKVNEKVLLRRLAAVQEMEQTLRRDNNKLKNEMIQIEATVTDRMGYYRRFKETANYKLNVIQRELEESVSKKDFEKLRSRFDELTEKYRNFLEKQNYLISRGQSITQIETEYNKLKFDHEALKKILETEKQRRHVLEAVLDDIGEGPTASTKARVSDAHLVSISKKMATLEMKELNERERADHAVRMYDNIKSTWNEAEKRNKELEEKLSSITNSNLQLQKIERELRDELIDSVSKEINDVEKRKVIELEKRDMEAKHEIEKLKEIAEIATMQANTLQEQQISRDKEASSLRQQLLDIQSQTDEKSLIGKLHRHIVHMQLSEAAALRKLDDAQRIQKRLEAQILKTEHICDEKDQNLYHTRIEARSRAKHLKETINSLRSQFSGSIPLSKQERFTNTLVMLTEEKSKLDKELHEILRAKFQAETELEAEKIVKKSQEELGAALKDKRNEKNILVQWNSKLEKLRLDELKERRQIDLLQHEIEHLESVIKCQEKQLARLEYELARMSNEYDEKELVWERRENELERTIYNLENIQGEVIIAANTFQEASGKKEFFGTMPDSNAPLPNQLEQAVSTIKKNIRVIFDKENENKSLKKQNKELETKIRELEGTLLKRERYVNELHLRLPATEDRPDLLGQLSDATVKSIIDRDKTDYADDKTMWAAMTTVSGLKERLKSKDDCLAKYELLLKEAREDLIENNKRHTLEVQMLQDQLNRLIESRSSNLIKSQNQNVIITGKISGQHLQRLQEAEELLSLEKHTTADQKCQIEEMQRLVNSLQEQLTMNDKVYQSRVRETESRNSEENFVLREEINNLQMKLSEKENQLEYLRSEIKRLKEEINRSPTVEMRNTVQRLKNQLAEKDKQMEMLKDSVSEVKVQLVEHAKDTIHSVREEMTKQDNIQKIVDKHTKDLKNEMETCRDQILQYQRELRSTKADKERAELELNGVKGELDHHEAQVKRLKSDRQKAEEENDELRNQIQRMKNLRSLTSNDTVKQELDELKLKLHLMEEENNRLKRQSIPEASVNNTKPFQWEDNKKTQLKADKLKEHLNELESENSKLKQQLDTTARALDRMKREKEVLEKRLTDKWGPAALIDVNEEADRISPVKIKQAFASPSKSRNETLERDIDTTDSKAVNHVALKEAEIRNRLLQKTVDDLERRLIQSGNASSVGMEKERALQKEVMRLTGENLELRFEAEAARKEVPRLKERLADMQKYADLIKAEKEAADTRTNRSLESTASTISNIRKIGESGKSIYELEKTVARLKKLVEKTQKENEKLKEAPGVVMNEQVDFLRSENANLKAELQELKEQIGQRLADRYDSKERGMAKIMGEYEKMRKDLNKEHNEHEQTRIDLKQASRSIEKLQREKLDLEAKLSISESRSHRSLSRGSGDMQEENKNLHHMVNSLQAQLKEIRKHREEQSEKSDSSKVEELKRNYRKAKEHITVLEIQLKNISEQFGVSIDLGR